MDRYLALTAIASQKQTCEELDISSRMQRVLSNTDLDCRCRSTLEEALNRFVAFERRRAVRAALTNARDRRDQIVGRLSFLEELDEVGDTETDRSAFAEMALLFDEIAAAADGAARAVRAIEAQLTARQ